MSGHSPTPWRFETVTTSCGHAHKFYPINACMYVDHRDMRETDAKTLEAKANAELIVRAVNSHSELIECVERWLSWCDNWHAGKPHPCDDLDFARAALAKAKGETT